MAEDINCRDAFEICALAAVRTSTIRLSTGVVNPYTRNPTSIAMALATLDEISGGRAQLGLGTSSPSLIQEQMGIPVGKPVAVMREATEVIRLLLKGEAVTYQGERFIYTGATLEVPAVRPHVPIFFAAMGPLMLRLVGRLADGVLLNVGASVEYIRWAVDEIMKGAKAAGRSSEDLTIAAWFSAYVTDDIGDGNRRAREWLSTMLSIPRQGELLLEHAGADLSILDSIRSHVGGYPHTGDPAAAASFVPEKLADRLALIGPPDRIRERLEEYRAAGVQMPVLSLTALRALT